MSQRGYRFGEFEFDPSSGELTPLDSRKSSASAPAIRLPPQPARLLELLAEAGGEVVTRETIRETIWPGVRVEFDSGLHFCVRQIRSALGDSASEPRYIGTLPRRGYRLLPAVEPVAPTPPSAGVVPPQPEVARPSRRRLAAALLVLFGAVAALLIFRGVETPVDASPAVTPARSAATSVGVMPFRPPTEWAARMDVEVAEVSTIAEGVLEALVQGGGEHLRVVGPSNTSPYTGTDRGLSDLALAFDLDYIVNGRFVVDGDGPRMLAELIRSIDGAHVWVQRYEDFDDGNAIAAEISREVLDRLVEPGQAGR